MTLQRRLDLIELAARRRILLMEDHAYSELYFGEPPPPTLSELTDGWGVLTVGTFSKVIATGLRVGWVQARPEWIQAMVPARFDMGNSPLLHRMLHEYMVRGDFREHVERMRGLYALKAKTLAGAIEPYGEPYFDLIEPSGGFFLWLKLRSGPDRRRRARCGQRRRTELPLGQALLSRRRSRRGRRVDPARILLAAGGDAGGGGGTTGAGVSSRGERRLALSGSIIPTQAGIHTDSTRRMGSRLRGHDEFCESARGLGPVSSTGHRASLAR